MKLKKTLSMLIGGICLVAATTVALAYPVMHCPVCGGSAPATYSYVTKGAKHNYRIGNRTYTCLYKVKCKRATYKCSDCNTTLTHYDTIISEYDHSCGMFN